MPKEDKFNYTDNKIDVSEVFDNYKCDDKSVQKKVKLKLEDNI